MVADLSETDLFHVGLTEHAPKSKIIKLKSIHKLAQDGHGRTATEQAISVMVHEFSSSHNTVRMTSASLSDEASAADPGVPELNLSDDASADADSEFATFTECLQSAKLFEKFIANEAYFCINISGSQRERLYEFFGFKDDEPKSQHIENMIEYVRERKVTKQLERGFG